MSVLYNNEKFLQRCSNKPGMKFSKDRSHLFNSTTTFFINNAGLSHSINGKV